jgi:hypothetical protein
MPRHQKNPLVFLALSPAATATALGVNYGRVIAPAIASGALIVRQCGAKRRIAVFGDGGIQQYFESLPQKKMSKPKRKVP